MQTSQEPFIGSAALAAGKLNRHQLRTQYQRMFPNIYLPSQIQPTLGQRIAAAWLWSGPQSIIAGLAAAALHGAQWIDDDVAVELIHANARPPQGVLTRRDGVLDDEVQMLAGRTVTTPERTAFDVGRRGSRRTAVARLDALVRATGINVDDVALIARRHAHTRGRHQLATALDLVDAGAESPQESYLRLLLIEAGFPRPHTQIPVVTEQRTYYLDMGWEELRVAVEYDGDQHRTDPLRHAYDLQRQETLQALGWLVIRVVAAHRAGDITQRVQRAVDARRAEMA